jgi:hypothetical protein
MRVELEFLDRAGTRVHERELGYDGAGPPIPGVGERVTLAAPGGAGPLATWRVTERAFTYVEGDAPPQMVGGGTRQEPSVKISFRCEPVP